MAAEEVRARAVLAEMQMRISQGPYAALGVPETASAEEVRAAFLQLTKQFHPARFGRMSGDVHRLANEVFLGIKGAHDQLTKLLGSSGRSAPVRPSSSGVFVPPTPGGTQRGIGLAPRSTPTTSPPQFARGTDRAPQRPATPNVTPSGGIPRVSTPNVTPSAGMPRLASPLVTPSGPRPGSQPASPARPASPPLGTTERLPSPPLQDPPRTPAGAGAASVRPTTPMPRIGTPPLRPPSPPSDALNAPTIRYSGVQPTPARSGGAFDEQRELAAAMELLRVHDWAAARQALHGLAAKMPQSRHYRALLCYARGRETQAAGRADDAVLEFQRALQLDPELEIAKQALRDLGRKSRW